MAKLQRATQSIFASGSSDVIVFGSDAAADLTYSQNVETIQSLGAWTAGWRSALINYVASLQNQDSVNYVCTSQLAYILQQGIPEYDVGTTYFTNSICKAVGGTQLYYSLVDNNLGNPLTDGAAWGVGANLGVNNSNNLLLGTPITGLTYNTIYQAATNGFLYIGYYLGNTGEYNVYIEVVNDTKSTPTTTVFSDNTYISVNWNRYGSVFIPINKNSYYKVGQASSLTVSFYPLAL